jgi:hypothetical protein
VRTEQAALGRIIVEHADRKLVAISILDVEVVGRSPVTLTLLEATLDICSLPRLIRGLT